MPQQAHEVPREAMGKIRAGRLMDNVGPLRFLWPFIPCFVDHYGCTIVGFYLWVVPEILEISGLVVNRFGLRSRLGRGLPLAFRRRTAPRRRSIRTAQESPGRFNFSPYAAGTGHRARQTWHAGLVHLC